MRSESCCCVYAEARPAASSASRQAQTTGKTLRSKDERVENTLAFYNRRVDSRPVGVFDSGVGGLTVLHECLVTMPHEDFVYLGDHARLPYGPRPLEEVGRFAREIGTYLEAQGVKLLLVACNTA